MPWQKTMLGWDRPALDLAAERIVGPLIGKAEWDLGSVLCVFPTRRAGRQFEELLADRADEAMAELIPPVIATAGWLDAHLLPPCPTRATRLQARAALATALRSLGPDVRGNILRRPPEEEDWRNWLGIAEALVRLRETLAANRQTFSSVAGRTGLFESDVDAARWRTLAELEARYLELLSESGAIDGLAYRGAKLSSGEVTWRGDIFVIAAVDLNLAQVAMLDAAANNGATVHALVHAPESLADCFDQSGCLQVEAWLAKPLDIADDRIHFVQGPSDQALAAISIVVDLSPDLSTDAVKIAVPDEEVTPRIVDAARRLGLSVQSAEGESAKVSGPFRLLETLLEYARSHSASALAEVFRHPDFHEWLIAKNRVTSIARIPVMIELLDAYRGERAPARIDPASAVVAAESPDLARAIKLAAPLVKHLEGEDRTTPQWAKSFSDLLMDVYGPRFSREGDGHKGTLGALGAIGTGLRALASVGETLLDRVAAEQAITLLAGEIETFHRGEDKGGEVELLGWLDLPLERAPVLVVTGMNEGKLSPRVESDMFLTDAIREALQLPTNEERLARDRYALAAMLASHRSVHLIAGKASAAGDPLAPSRLILGDSTETRARRSLAFFDRPGRRLQFARAASDPIRIEIPKPEDVRPLESLSVTAFSTYLKCPYRFYLRYVLRLESVEDEISELDPAQYGTLAHQVLERFGLDESIRDSTDAKAIRDFLDAHVLELAKQSYADSSPAVHVQLELLRARLARFAEWQASWAGQGWRIRLTEQNVGNGVAWLDVDGEKFWLRGKIDRVDVHVQSDEVAILDYKTGEKGEIPEAAHRNRAREWFNLQLPLYRHLLGGLKSPEVTIGKKTTVHLGYILLPKDLDAVGVSLAEWDEDDLRDADETARRVIRDIRACKFEEMGLKVEGRFPEYARICQEGVYREQK